MKAVYAKFLKDYGKEIKALTYKLDILEAKLKEFFKVKSYTNGNYKIDIEAKLKEYIKIKFRDTYATDNSKLSVLEAELKEYFIGNHRRSWVIFRGGPTIPSCQNSIPSCQNFFLSGGAKFADFVLPC